MEKDLKTLKDLELYFPDSKIAKGMSEECVSIHDLKAEGIKWVKEIKHPDFKLNISEKDGKKGEGYLKEYYYPLVKMGMEAAFLLFFNIERESLK